MGQPHLQIRVALLTDHVAKGWGVKLSLCFKFPPASGYTSRSTALLPTFAPFRVLVSRREADDGTR